MLHVYITLIQANHWNGDEDDDYSRGNDYDHDEANEYEMDNNDLNHVFFFVALVLGTLQDSKLLWEQEHMMIVFYDK